MERATEREGGRRCGSAPAPTACSLPGHGRSDGRAAAEQHATVLVRPNPECNSPTRPEAACVGPPQRYMLVWARSSETSAALSSGMTSASAKGLGSRRCCRASSRGWVGRRGAALPRGRWGREGYHVSLLYIVVGCSLRMLGPWAGWQQQAPGLLHTGSCTRRRQLALRKAHLMRSGLRGQSLAQWPAWPQR
jgi:hypothetical protein